ncbi:hypothetical protein KTE19_09730 [Lentilactobacillus sp. IMAU92037]|uniref:N-terminal phage integrase SAM-like domain-containing protein n=1 Tax=Lentilactobacillus TaxID=2767893 RepID=UPI001C27673C|nr:hypothetical protein [Lentilactobacillus dabitei]MBV0930974.1 hypothetical protein [Lentilactobacillus dabitei]
MIQYKNTVKESSWATTQRIFRLHILPVFGNTRLKRSLYQCVSRLLTTGSMIGCVNTIVF